MVKTTLFTVILFAIAMAWVESAAVLYLRTAVSRIEPHQQNPLPEGGILGGAELVREAATLMMIAAVGWMAGRRAKLAIAYGLVAFGTWDIFYYVFLKILTGWPHSLLDWDVLFLLPLPWWGPVLAPTIIATFMILGGILVIQAEQSGQALWPSRPAILTNLLGIILALFVFMKDALAALKFGPEAVRGVLPLSFDWPLFILACALMTVPLFELARKRYAAPRGLSATPGDSDYD